MDKNCNQLVESPDTYFKLESRNKLKLTRNAAIEVCRRSEKKGLLVFRIEGGIWWNPKFEARVDSIWDGYDLPCDRLLVRKSNLLAEKFLEAEPEEYNAFIITSVRF